MAESTLIEGVRQALDEELARDERVFLVGEDVGPRGGVFRATQGLFEKYGPERIIDSPLAELSIVGVGIGAALSGMRPICEIQFADFIHPAFNQIVNEAAKMCYRSAGEWTVPLVIRAPYGGGIGGGVFRVGGGVSAPQIVFKVDPEYSEQARKSKYQGTVVLNLVVQKDGSVRDIRVVEQAMGDGMKRVYESELPVLAKLREAGVPNDLINELLPAKAAEPAPGAAPAAGGKAAAPAKK